MAGHVAAKTKKMRLAAAALALTTFAGACAADAEADVAADVPSTTAAASAAPETAAPETAAPGNALPVLEPSNTVDGSQLDWASLEGKDVMVWFWAPW